MSWERVSSWKLHWLISTLLIFVRANDGVKGTYHRVFKSLQDQLLKLQTCIERDMGSYIWDLSLTKKLLVTLKVYWSNLAYETEDYYLLLVTTMYADNAFGNGITDHWLVIITMVWVIWRGLQKFRVQDDTYYLYDYPHVIIVQYIWGSLQAHQVMGGFNTDQFRQNLEIFPRITLYIF